MKGYQAFLAIFCIIYSNLVFFKLNKKLKEFFFLFKANFENVNSLTCKSGFAISQPGSSELKTYFSNTAGTDNCGASGAANPSSEPKGCHVIICFL